MNAITHLVLGPTKSTFVVITISPLAASVGAQTNLFFAFDNGLRGAHLETID